MSLELINYHKSTVSIISSILNYYKIVPNHPTNKELDEVLKKDYDNIIVLIFDGFARMAVSKLDDNSIIKRNRFLTLNTVFPPTTTAATTSYISELYPSEHGFLGWSCYFKEVNRTVELFTNMDHFLKEKLPINIADSFLHYDEIFERIKKKDINAVKLMVSYIAKNNDVSYYDDSLDIIYDQIDNRRKNFIYYYNVNPDSLMHEFGVEADVVKEKISYFEIEITKLVEKFKNSKTLILQFADHGLIDIDQYINLYEYKDIMKLLVMAPTLESRATTFFVKSGLQDEFKTVFKKHFPDFLLLSKIEVANIALFGPSDKIHHKVDDFIGDYLAISLKKRAFTYANSFIKPTLLKAHHAGLTDDEMLVDIILYDCY